MLLEFWVLSQEIRKQENIRFKSKWKVINISTFFQAVEGVGVFEGDRRPHRYKKTEKILIFPNIIGINLIYNRIIQWTATINLKEMINIFI